MRLLAFFLLALVLPVAEATIEAYEFDSPQMEADYNQLINELRCLVCQNQNLAASDADLAKDLRRETYAMLQQGKSTDEVVEFMVARYGDFVLYRPPFQTSTYLLWIGPFVLLTFVLYFFVRWLRKRERPEEVEVDSGVLEQARQLLEQDDTKS